MNIHTERLEDHTARFTVEIDQERLERAKQSAARSLAKRVTIPGFRKGKAPYRILAQYLGEAAILQDAVEELSQEIYRETLDQADIEPYGPGSWENFTLDPVPTFIYTVPLQPTVVLGDYRGVRLEYEPPTVEDTTVDQAMRQLQHDEALVEESSRPVAVGNRVVIDIHSEFVDDPITAGTEQGEDAAVRNLPPKGSEFIHEHDFTVMMDVDTDPIIKGFREALLGANAGESVEFDLTVQDDDEEFKDIIGRTIHFGVTVKKIEVVTLPALNDDFAARLTANEPEPLTLLQLRMQVRERLQSAAERQGRAAFADRVLEAIVKGAQIAYPDAMIEEQIDSMLEDLTRRLQEQGLNLETYYRVTGRLEQDVRGDYRAPAQDIIKRTLTLRELILAEKIRVSESHILRRIDEIAAQFGEQAEMFRGLLDTPQMRANLQNELLEQLVLDRIIALARGEEIPVEAAEEEAVLPAVSSVPEETPVEVIEETTTAREPEVEAGTEPSNGQP